MSDATEDKPKSSHRETQLVKVKKLILAAPEFYERSTCHRLKNIKRANGYWISRYLISLIHSFSRQSEDKRSLFNLLLCINGTNTLATNNKVKMSSIYVETLTTTYVLTLLSFISKCTIIKLCFFSTDCILNVVTVINQGWYCIYTFIFCWLWLKNKTNKIRALFVFFMFLLRLIMHMLQISPGSARISQAYKPSLLIINYPCSYKNAWDHWMCTEYSFCSELRYKSKTVKWQILLH